jgi:HEPN domain-containing protein
MSDPTEAAAETRRWLRFARTDLKAAEQLADVTETAAQACYFAQQAAEKVMKTLFVYRQIDFPFIHDLDALRQLVPAEFAAVHKIESLASLTRRASLSRYPAAQPEPTSADASSSLQLARQVLRVVEGELESKGWRD